LWGTLSGFIYIAIMLLISISTVGSFSFSPKMLISIGLALCCGALGGVIGINTNK
jgi:putative membrane protein (TIGR04086 family)